MARRTDDRIRTELLAAIVEHLVDAGLTGLSLRPLAAAVGASPRTLLYHFGSKDELVAEVLDEVRHRVAALLEAWSERTAEHDSRTLLLRAWQWFAAPRHEKLFRLFFECYALGLSDRRRYGAFLRGAAADWTPPVARSLEERGFARERAAALATLVVAVARGLLVELLATGDRARADRAFRSFINAIELPADPDGHRAVSA